MNTFHPWLKLLRPSARPLCGAFVALAVSNLAALGIPWILKVVIDDVAGGGRYELLTGVTVILLAVVLLKFLFSYLAESSIASCAERLIRDLRQRIYRQLQVLSVGYIERAEPGMVVSRFTGDVEVIKKFLFSGALDFVYALFHALFVLGILLWVDAGLAVVSVAWLPVCLAIYVRLTPKLKHRHAGVREHYEKLTGRLTELLAGIRVVAGLGREESELERFTAVHRDLTGRSLAAYRSGVLLWLGVELLSTLGIVALVWFGVRAIREGRLTTGELVAFYAYLGMLLAPVIKMTLINAHYQEAAAAMERIEQLLEAEPQVAAPACPIDPGRLKGSVVFDNVGFGYTSQRRVLEAIHVRLEPSQVLAVVGKSGAGKTTFVNLLLRFYDPQQGRILIDGHDLRTLDLIRYREQIGLVLQDDYLFSETIRENIRYAAVGASDHAVEQAARAAHAHDFIMALPRGYDTCIGERGAGLSCGQRQRISIARAILRDPAILVLDEPTSGIDSETERAIIEDAFATVMKGRTTIIITHRLASVRHADSILVLDGGRVIEHGTHDDLSRRQGLYAALLREQVRPAGTVQA